MTERRFIIYIAASLDGYIASADGGVEWLDEFQSGDFDFAGFDRTIDTFVMGRKTFDQSLTFGPWMHSDRRTVVLTTRPIENPPEGVEAFEGDVGELAAALRAAGGKHVWVMGGGDTVRQFVSAESWDELILFVMPTLLGRGVPLFPSSDKPGAVELTKVERFDNGVVRLDYRRR